jgi:hypothetical protein
MSCGLWEGQHNGDRPVKNSRREKFLAAEIRFIPVMFYREPYR